MNGLRSKHLLGLEGVTADEINLILDTAASFKEISERPVKKVPALRGKTVVNLFFEASTRTRASFELAEKRLERGHGQHLEGGDRASPRARRSATPRRTSRR